MQQNKFKKTIKAIIFLFKKFNPIIIFSMIFIIGVYFRFYNIFNTLEWFGDAGRDILVAKHIATYGENFFISPDAYGGMHRIHNSPAYFWILSFFWFITRSAEGTILLFCLIGVACIPLAYLVSKKLSHNLVALVFPYLISVSSIFIHFSRNIWQPHLLPFFQLVSIFFYIKGLQKQNYMFLSVQFAFFATHIHLSYIPLLITTFLLALFYLLKKREFVMALLLLLLVATNINIFLYVTNKTRVIHIPNGSYLVQPIDGSFFPLFLQHSHENIEVISKNVLQITHSTLVFSSIVVFVILGLIKVYGFSRGIKKEISFMIITMILSFFLIGVYMGDVHFHYLYPYLLLFILALTFVLSNIRSRYKYICALLVILCITPQIRMRNAVYFEKREIGELEINQRVSHKIYEFLKTPDVIIKVCLVRNADCANIDSFTSSVWYFMEEAFHSKLGRVANPGNGNNYVPYSDGTLTPHRFVVCRYDTYDCLQNFSLNEEMVYKLMDENDTSVFYFNQRDINL